MAAKQKHSAACRPALAQTQKDSLNCESPADCGCALGVRKLGVARGRRAAQLRLAHAVLRARIAVGPLPAWVARGALRRGPVLANANACAGAPAL